MALVVGLLQRGLARAGTLHGWLLAGMKGSSCAASGAGAPGPWGGAAACREVAGGMQLLLCRPKIHVCTCKAGVCIQASMHAHIIQLPRCCRSILGSVVSMQQMGAWQGRMNHSGHPRHEHCWLLVVSPLSFFCNPSSVFKLSHPTACIAACSSGTLVVANCAFVGEHVNWQIYIADVGFVKLEAFLPTQSKIWWSLLHLLQRVSRASASPTLGMSTGSIGPIGHDWTDTMAEPRSKIAARFVQQLHESPGQLQALLAAPPLPAGEQRSKSTVWSDISCCRRPQHLSWGLSSSVQTRWVLSCRMRMQH
jgi:hypothetical protein